MSDEVDEVVVADKPCDKTLKKEEQLQKILENEIKRHREKRDMLVKRRNERLGIKEVKKSFQKVEVETKERAINVPKRKNKATEKMTKFDMADILRAHGFTHIDDE